MRSFNWKTISRGLTATFALAVAQLPAGQVAAADYNVGSIHISQPWARATPKGASSAAGYMTVINNGTKPDRFSCVSSDAAAQCQIHSMTIEGGVMKMRPVEGGLEIKPGQTVMLKPGSFHVMFVDLKHRLQQGKAVEATFKFDNAGTVEVEFPIAAIGAPAPGASGQQMKMQRPGGMTPMNKR
jgi:periplasmic copper chaperone A